MALSPEDKKDVKGAMGKALANKVHKVTMDGKTNLHAVGGRGKTSYPFSKPGSAAHIKAHGMDDIPSESPRGRAYWDAVKKSK